MSYIYSLEYKDLNTEMLKSAFQLPIRYPDIEYKEVIVDNACMQLVRDPTQYDMLVMPNLYVSATCSLSPGCPQLNFLDWDLSSPS